MSSAKCGSLKGNNYCKYSWQALGEGSSTLRIYLLIKKLSQKKTSKPKEKKIVNLSLFIFFPHTICILPTVQIFFSTVIFFLNGSDLAVWGVFGNYYFTNNKTAFWVVCPPAEFLKMHAINQLLHNSTVYWYLRNKLDFVYIYSIQ